MEFDKERDDFEKCFRDWSLKSVGIVFTQSDMILKRGESGNYDSHEYVHDLWTGWKWKASRKENLISEEKRMNNEQEREAFKKHYGALFDLTETPDVWGNPRFVHEFVAAQQDGARAYDDAVRKLQSLSIQPIDDKSHPRFMAGYDAGMKDAKLSMAQQDADHLSDATKMVDPAMAGDELLNASSALSKVFWAAPLDYDKLHAVVMRLDHARKRAQPASGEDATCKYDKVVDRK